MPINTCLNCGEVKNCDINGLCVDCHKKLYKRCKGECGEVKPMTSFHKDKQVKGGRKNTCMACFNKRSALNRDLKKKGTLKILCEKNNTMIRRYSCIPGCNDACKTCKSRQEGNVRAINTLTEAEDKEFAYTGVMGGQFGRMTEDMGF